MDGKKIKIDWDDIDQVEKEAERAQKLFPHLNDCAASQGTLCPACGAGGVETIRAPEGSARKLITRRCQACGCGFTQYTLNPDHQDHWAPSWREDVVSYSIEDYPFYIFYTAGGSKFEGVGPAVFPWES